VIFYGCIMICIYVFVSVVATNTEATLYMLFEDTQTNLSA
jgi:hypothetical protein